MFMFIQMRVRVYMLHLCILVCADDIQVCADDIQVCADDIQVCADDILACACIDVWFVRVTL